MKKIITTLFFILILAFGGIYIGFKEIGLQGSAFAAKNLCSGVFVSRMPADIVMEQAIIPASPPLAYANYTIDEDAQVVSANILGLYSRRAQFRERLGCTIIPLDTKGVLTESIQSSSLAVIFSNLDVNTDNPSLNYDAVDLALDYAFAENDPRGIKNTKAVVVMFQGEVVAERYADEVDADTPLLGWSMTKSITNMLVGILVRDGKLDINQPAPVSEWKTDERRQITINNLLHMSSGLEFNETYGMATDVTQMLTAEADAGAFAASKPLIHPPNTYWDYSSGTTNIIARIIQQQVGGSLQAMYSFAQTELFQPLNINSVHFEPDPSGVLVGSSFSYLSGRDWAKLGQLMLNRGEWQGRQILTEDWVDYTLAPAAANKLNEYGAHFWLNLDPEDASLQRTWPDVPTDAFSMNGYQGQHVAIIPSKELVVVRLGFTPRPARPGMNEVLKEIIQAVQE